MPKLLAIVSTLTTLAVLATNSTAFASDHRHGARGASSPPPAAAVKLTKKPKTIAVKLTKKPKTIYVGGNSFPATGTTAQRK